MLGVIPAFASSTSSANVVDQQKACRLSKLREEHASLSSLARMLIFDRLDALYEQTESPSAVKATFPDAAVACVNGGTVA
ncbi:unnamed protein product [Dibothriocephalus latus]|uniref:Uncharacterized protein n=1 Tax=Dibothriocephalus latus TaxID=60516 RepID=A0A3P7LG51_DIBLA|nr:unnamed protein product [Dibothriocephalus latus]